MQTLLRHTPLPSPSPALAKLIGRMLAAGRPNDDREIAVRAQALKQGGRANELAELLGVPLQSLASGEEGAGATASPMALFFLAQDDQEDAELGLPRPNVPQRSTSSTARRSDALIARRRQSFRNRRGRPRRSEPSSSPRSTHRPRQTPVRSSIDALLASGKDAGIEIAIAEALAETSAGLAQDPQAARFAETGIRVAALAGEDQAAWAWVETGGERVQSYELLLGAVDPYGERAREALSSGVEIATRSRLPGPVLQRLVTVLDALGEEVPIPLWELASKTPEPEDGYLPETGVLSALKEASDGGEVGRTVLLAATALGPKGPQDAHLIALGDALRALRRAGLDAEARRIALEALLRHWPSHGKA